MGELGNPIISNLFLTPITCPVVGYFAQADSIIPENQGVQAWDRYGSVSNNPLRYTDPTGHKNCEEDCCNCLGDRKFSVLGLAKLSNWLKTPIRRSIAKSSLLDKNSNKIKELMRHAFLNEEKGCITGQALEKVKLDSRI